MFFIDCNSVMIIYVQDVKDVLHAIDYVIDMGLADSSKIAVTGISHGGFLTTHLIGQVTYRPFHLSQHLLVFFSSSLAAKSSSVIVESILTVLD